MGGLTNMAIYPPSSISVTQLTIPPLIPLPELQQPWSCIHV